MRNAYYLGQNMPCDKSKKLSFYKTQQISTILRNHKKNICKEME